MPQIKPYVQQTDVPGQVNVQRANAEDFGAGSAREFGNLGETVGRFGDVMQQREEQEQRTKLNVDMSEAQAKLTVELQKQTQDGTLNTDDFMKTVGATMDQAQEDLTTPGARRDFEKNRAELSAHFLTSAASNQAVLAGDKAKASYSTGLENRSSSIMQDPSDQNFQLALRQQSDSVQVAIDGGLPAKLGPELQRHGETELAKSWIKGWMIKNPDVAEAKIKAGEVDQYLTGDQKYTLLSEARQAKIAEIADGERVRRLQKEALQEQQKVTQNDFLTKLENNTLSWKEIQRSNLDPFGSGSKETFLQMMKTKNKETNTALQRSDPYLVNKLFDDIHSGKLTNENDLNAYFGPGQLSEKDLRWLRNEAQGKGTTEGRDEQVLKNSFIASAKNAIAKPDPLTRMADPQAMNNYVAWLSQFSQRYQQGRAEGKSARSMLAEVNSPNYLGGDFGNYQRTLQEITQDLVKGRQANTQGEMVNVVSPDGRTGRIPKSKLDEKIKLGYKVK